MPICRIYRRWRPTLRFSALMLCGFAAGGPISVAQAASAAGALAPPASAAPDVVPPPKTVAAHVTAEAVEPFTYHYGLYVGGKKVGYMRASLRYAPEPKVAFCLQARVAGMGRSAEVVLREERQYGGKDQLLQRIDFAQHSEGSSVQVHGRRRGTQMVLVTEAGGARTEQRLAVDERLRDSLAAALLARSAPAPGTRASARHLDAASQRMVPMELTVQPSEATLVAGVRSETVRVLADYPELKVQELSTYDAQGKLLAAKVGGFFEARLEDEATAKAMGTVQDVLLGAVVAVPGPLAGVREAERLELTFAPLEPGATVAPSARHEVTTVPEGLRVRLHRDPPWSEPYAPAWRRKTQQKLPPEVARELGPTPYLQSEAPPIVAMARQAVGDAKDVGTAVARLCAAVRGRLRPEYVPAFSNALQAYHDRRGDCTEHSALFAALARAAGLPTRTVVGIAYWPAGGGFGWHAWDEVWAEGRWRQVDPTWDQPLADVTHLKLAEGGPAEQASVVMLLGQLHLRAWQVPPA